MKKIILISIILISVITNSYAFLNGKLSDKIDVLIKTQTELKAKIVGLDNSITATAGRDVVTNDTSLMKYLIYALCGIITLLCTGYIGITKLLLKALESKRQYKSKYYDIKNIKNKGSKK